MTTWIIEDWAGNHILREHSFDNYGSARDWITEYADEVSEDANEFLGICEDLYAVPVDEDGNKITVPDTEYQY